MKFNNLLLAVLTLAVSLTACKRQGTEIAPQGAGVVVFPDAGVSIDVGEGWRHVNAGPNPPVCPPTLVGPAGMVQALLFAPLITDISAATNAVHSMFDRNPGAVKDSYRQESFVTDSGLHGQHIAYSAQTEENGKTTELRSHNFIVQRADGRCVAIGYLAPSGDDSVSVEQMIEKSLRLQ